ncbi:MAG: hypothetical protein QOD75_192 [Blastocatellia bacterium]|jgi:uncharacterized protein (TIGR02611 family)|nr:hypothetical protein [Blastocatellia bacterium]
MDVQQKATDIKSTVTKFIRVDDIPWLRKAIVGVIGFTVLLIGVVMIVLPGPAIIVIPLGLAILATEFVWAQRLLKRAQEMVKQKKLKPKKSRGD